MDFSFNADIADLEEGAKAFLAGANSVERLRLDGDNPTALWQQLADLGLLGITAGQDLGGLGVEFSDAVKICQAFGYSGLPEPAGETIAVIVPVLLRCGENERLQKLIPGESRIALAHESNPCINLLDGSHEILVATQDSVSLHPAASVAAPRLSAVDPWRHLSQLNDPGEATKILAEGEDAAALYREMAIRGAVDAAAQMCGLAERMIKLATDYANERQQFGQVIGKFQAVKHLLATSQVKLEFARPVVYRAAADIGHPKADLFAAHAKVAATETAMLAGETAIQVFGGMGYTYEADLHYFMKRVWALTGTWGSREYHLSVIERAINHTEFDIGPAATFAGQG